MAAPGYGKWTNRRGIEIQKITYELPNPYGGEEVHCV